MLRVCVTPVTQYNYVKRIPTIGKNTRCISVAGTNGIPRKHVNTDVSIGNDTLKRCGSLHTLKTVNNQELNGGSETGMVLV